ncbi:MAG: phenylalanine--tRNA ligase subunit beta [Opitutales bacterium]
MRVSFQSLERHVDLAGVTPAQVADLLPMLGLEVDSVVTFGLQPIAHLVVGEIRSFEKHPKADRLSVCQVDTGDGALRQIVCGAKNFKAGDRVPVALPGAVLPGNFEIKASKLRDVDSHGMLCSADELGLPAGEDGLLILTARQPALGTPIHTLFPAPDTVLEVAVTANRGDCLGLRGVAREVAAALGRPLKPLEARAPSGTTDKPGTNDGFGFLRVTAKACPYYTLRTLRGVKVGPAPDWMRRDLEAAGLRAVNNVVDITNWVMLQTGQPLHAFDAAKVRGGIEVRAARAGETLTLLDGRKLALAEGDCVIADETRPLVLAGVMGGSDSGVSDATMDVLLESAWFAPGEVRRVARAHTLATDSSQRFARDVDPAGVDFAARLAADLLIEHAGARAVGPAVVAGKAPRTDRLIKLPAGFVATKLGMPAPEEQVAGVLRRIGFGVHAVNSGLEVTVPSFRSDVDRPIDLVEEYIRIHGTAQVPVGRPVAPPPGEDEAPAAALAREAGLRLAGAGFSECYHYSLRESAEVERVLGVAHAAHLALQNPLTADQTHLRPSLLPGLARALQLNLSVSADPTRLFEVGTVFRPQADGQVREFLAIAFVALAEPVRRSWKARESIDLFSAKRLVADLAALAGLAPSRLAWSEASTGVWQAGHAAALADRGKAAEGACGLLDLRWTRALDIRGSVVAGELLLPRATLATARKPVRFEAFSSFPPVTRDLALIVPVATGAGDVAERLRQAAAKAVGKEIAVESVNCFDVFSGEGLPADTRSLAFEITLRHGTRTLTDTEVSAALDQVAAAAGKAGWNVRR